MILDRLTCVQSTIGTARSCFDGRSQHQAKYRHGSLIKARDTPQFDRNFHTHHHRAHSDA